MKKIGILFSAILTALAVAVTPAAAAGKKGGYEHRQARYIGVAKAKQIAVKRIGGGRVGDVDFERGRKGRGYYNIEVKRGGNEYDVLVDARTGRVLSVRSERDRINEPDEPYDN